jgi:cobalt-zinc-cadmium efflux system outer membrane protein
VDRIVSDSPLVRQAQQEIVRAEAELKSARRESIPDLQIHAGLQQNSEPINLNPRVPVGLQGFATAGIDLPIFNRNQGNVAAGRAKLENSQAEARRVELLVRQAAQVLLQNYLSAQDKADRYRTQLIPRATRAYQLYLEKYQQMAAAYPQVLISQRTLFQLQLAYVDALQKVWTNALMLQNYALTSGLSAPAAGPSAEIQQAASPDAAY